MPKRTEQFPTLNDFYNTYDEYKVTERDKAEYEKFVATLNDKERDLINSGLNFYVVSLKNVGGLVMPVIFELEYTDGTKEEMRIPAEIWRYNNTDAVKLIVSNKELKSITLDPHLETADTDLNNNYFPRRLVKSRFQVFKDQQSQPNPMQQQERKPGDTNPRPNPQGK